MMNRISFMFGLLFATFCFATDGNMAGDGTVDNPWQVADYEDLKAIGVGSYSMNGHYVLVAYLTVRTIPYRTSIRYRKKVVQQPCSWE